MTRITEPKPGFWLRVEPETEFDKQKVRVVTVIEAGDQMFILDCYDTGGYVSDDPKGTEYLPISLELLRAAARLAKAIGSDDFAMAISSASIYNFEVQRAVGE